jgi:hypothetical protein
MAKVKAKAKVKGENEKRTEHSRGRHLLFAFDLPVFHTLSNYLLTDNS